MKRPLLLLLGISAISLSAWAEANDAAIADTSPNAFGRTPLDVRRANWFKMLAGKRIFVRRWSGDRRARTADGLGPLFVARACTSCHFKDGRGGVKDRHQKVPAPLLFRLPDGRAADHPWGAQLQTLSVVGPPEATVDITYRSVRGRYADGAPYVLRTPSYRVRSSDASARLSARIPPTLIGVGFIEAVERQVILERADPEDSDGDGISGRPFWPANGGRRVLGRFGWRAEQSNLQDQTLVALAEDIGISSAQYPRAGCPPGDKVCGTADVDINASEVKDLVTYLRLLAPPAPRSMSTAARRGAQLFDAIGCEGCHRKSFVTGSDGGPEKLQELANKRIAPFSDLLLHDLGPDLADDGVNEPRISRREWRTAPLWGLGLLKTVNGTMMLLHDGRAQSFAEAILWHGGEAAQSRERFVRLSGRDRQALIAFLEAI